MKKLLLVVTLICMIISCGNKGDKSKKFEGNWGQIKPSPGWVISIKKIDQNFTVEAVYKSSSAARDKWVASYNKENDRLELSGGADQKGGAIIFDSKSGHIITDWGEFEKIK